MASRCEAWSANSGQAPIAFNNTAPYELLTPVMPPGNYVVHAKIVVGDRSAAGNGEFNCTLRHGQTGNIWIDLAYARVFGGSPFAAGSLTTLPLTGTVTLKTKDRIRLLCGTTSSDAAVQAAQLNAISVDKITT